MLGYFEAGSMPYQPLGFQRQGCHPGQRVERNAQSSEAAVKISVLPEEQTSDPGQDSVREDHRTRVARQRRQRMETDLLRAVMEVYPAGHGSGPAVIDDVIRQAGVSRGTFYKYFTSLDEAVDKLGARMADEMAEAAQAIHGPLKHPVMRTATGFQLYVLRALIEPHWGAFLTHIGLLKDDSLMVRLIRADVALGQETGDYDIDSVDVATDLLLGAQAEAISRIVANGADVAYVQAMTFHVLRSFGVNRPRAARAVEEAYRLIEREGPTQIAWWQMPPPSEQAASAR
ncbi:TetR/AcrR family transcriptional regulator [Novosphingobium naphthalenivorans]|uniref:TetR/AcrR family transcriptional regulator n=2 Tax=Alphaproteobacteria TaxID=28211 RepID=UPI0012EE96F0|nr:TetR/AcrR family transcriptional regulator [Novosphingobium naphthalenivorans]